VQALPSALALVAAFVLAPPALRALAQAGFLRRNYRERMLPFPAGFVIVVAGMTALVVCAPLQELADAGVLRPETALVVLYGVGVAFLGLVDDVFSPESRGWRGHGRAVLGGGFSTGALKAAGSLGLALYSLAGRYDQAWRYLLAVAVLVLATNLFNLLDLRPGRSTKAFVLLGAGLTIGAWDAGPLAAIGLLGFPAVALGVYDLRERAMLGDTGSNLLGALAGLWIVLSLGATGQLIALALIALATVYGEFRSLSALIERTPVLRQLDSLGRSPTHA
jgi:UDP-N-acetylmuramyl pentapeptide phosphotransferase/UDP-N-acetylglucosamine-1-phosphate transferase